MTLTNCYNWLNKNCLLISALFGLISFSVLLIVKIKVSLSFLPDISGSETSTIFPIQLLINGDPIYVDPEKAPFRFVQYTPIYFCIVTFFYKFTDWSALDVHKVFVASRFFSLLFTFCASMTSGFLVYKLTNKNKIAAILSATFIYHVLAYWFLTSSRPDSLLVLLTTLYLIAIYYATDTNNSSEGWWFLAIFIGVTVFFVKQSGAIHSIALGLYLLYQKQWKLLFKIVAAGIAFFGIYLLVLPINTIPLFFDNIVGGVSNSVSWDWFYHWTMEKLVLQFATVLVLNILISVYFFTKPGVSAFNLFLSIASVLFFAFATLTSFKIGAGVGYYQDYLVVSVVQITAFFADGKYGDRLSGKFSRVGLSLYLVFVYLHCTLFVFMTYKNVETQNYMGEYTDQRNVSDYLLNEKKLKKEDWVYVDGGTNFTGYYIRHFLFNQTLAPFADLVFLADKNKTYQFSNFRNMIDNKQVKYVITDHGRAPINILNHSFGNTLKLSSTIGPYDIYESNNIAKN